MAKANSTHSDRTKKLTRKIADAMTTDVIRYFQATLLPKYGFTDGPIDLAMEAIYREWCGEKGVCVPVFIDEDSDTMCRLEDRAERQGCTIGAVARMAVTEYMELLPTTEEQDEAKEAVERQEDRIRAKGMGTKLDDESHE